MPACFVIDRLIPYAREAPVRPLSSLPRVPLAHSGVRLTHDVPDDPVGGQAIATEFVQGLRGPDSATVIVEQRSVADSIAVARELRDQNVAGILMEMIHSKLQKNGQENILAAALSPYTSLLQHGLINPDSILDDFVQGIMKLVNSAASSSNVTQSCLRFLAAYVHKCSRGYEIVTRPGGVSLATVTEKVKNPDPAMQCGALCLFNRLVMVAPTEAEKSGILDAFRQDDVFEALRKRVTDPSSAPVQSRDPTFAHELAVFQRLWVNRVAATARTMFSQEEHKPKFRVLRDGLGDASGENSGKSVRTTQAGIVKTNKSLGFTDPNNPHMDFLSPPGVLALENMVHFCRKHQHDYGQVVLDQSSRTDGSACPFVQTSVSVTSLMLHVLGVGQAPADDLYDYIPALFTSQNGFQELFCVLIQVAMKTWREMDAKTSDMAKVLRVVNKQLESVLAVPVLTPPKLPEPGAIPLPEKAPTSMDSFKLALMAITFEDIVKAEAGDWQQLAEEQLVSEAVQDAKERIEEAVTELVRQQRFDVMTQGAWFNVPAKGRLKKGAAPRAACVPSLCVDPRPRAGPRPLTIPPCVRRAV